MFEIIGQIRIPVTMLFSHSFLNTKYISQQFVGVLVIVVGVIVSALPSTDSVGVSGPLSSHQLSWTLLFILAAFPSCLANVFREKILTDSEFSPDPFRLALWISVCQFLLGFPLLFFLFPFSGVEFVEIPDYIRAGLACWLQVR
jgi:drug/metabolite transporter (DMT)-like permease